ncbi:hypothetical protein ACVWZV_001626 [Bradyrhizobium sp. GM5.1]
MTPEVVWRRLVVASSRYKRWGNGSPEFTNEVQHFHLEVLPWGGLTNSSPLTIDARLPAFPLSANGGSVGQIAAALDRPPSTISRELRRNRGRQVGYKPSYAQQQTRARRWKGSRLERDASLRREVLAGLSRGWSPEQVAGRLARERGRRVISCESIYRFIYAQITRTTDFTWRRYLPRGKSKRGHRGKRGGSPASFIEGRVSLAERPAEVADRKVPGHWEADLMMFSPNTGRPSWPSTSEPRACCSPFPSNASSPPVSLAISYACSKPYRRHCAVPSPSTTAPSSPPTFPCSAS